MLLDVLSWTVSDVLDVFDDCAARHEPRPPGFEEVEHGEGRGRVRIESWGRVFGAETLNLRYCRVQGAVMDIATVMIYPIGRPDLLPVFAVEWVVVAGKCQVGVLDVEALGNHPELAADMATVFGGAGAQWQQALPPGRTAPAWFEDIATPWALLTACPVDRVPDLRAAQSAYLSLTWENYYAPALQAPPPPAAEHHSVLAYKSHHAIHSPGTKVMTPKLGAEWTQRFLHEFHFGPVQPSAIEPAPAAAIGVGTGPEN